MYPNIWSLGSSGNISHDNIAATSIVRYEKFKCKFSSLNFVKEFRRFLAKNRLKSAKNRLKSAKIG